MPRFSDPYDEDRISPGVLEEINSLDPSEYEVGLYYWILSRVSIGTYEEVREIIGYAIDYIRKNINNNSGVETLRYLIEWVDGERRQHHMSNDEALGYIKLASEFIHKAMSKYELVYGYGDKAKKVPTKGTGSTEEINDSYKNISEWYPEDEDLITSLLVDEWSEVWRDKKKEILDELISHVDEYVSAAWICEIQYFFWHLYRDAYLQNNEEKFSHDTIGKATDTILTKILNENDDNLLEYWDNKLTAIGVWGSNMQPNPTTSTSHLNVGIYYITDSEHSFIITLGANREVRLQVLDLQKVKSVGGVILSSSGGDVAIHSEASDLWDVSIDLLSIQAGIPLDGMKSISIRYKGDGLKVFEDVPDIKIINSNTGEILCNIYISSDSNWDKHGEKSSFPIVQEVYFTE